MFKISEKRICKRQVNRIKIAYFCKAVTYRKRPLYPKNVPLKKGNRNPKTDYMNILCPANYSWLLAIPS